jgi:hypothetical protein
MVYIFPLQACVAWLSVLLLQTAFAVSPDQLGETVLLNPNMRSTN